MQARRSNAIRAVPGTGRGSHADSHAYRLSIVCAGTLTRDFKHTQLDFQQYIDQKETEEDEEEAPEVLSSARQPVSEVDGRSSMDVACSGSLWRRHAHEAALAASASL